MNETEDGFCTQQKKEITDNCKMDVAANTNRIEEIRNNNSVGLE